MRPRYVWQHLPPGWKTEESIDSVQRRASKPKIGGSALVLWLQSGATSFERTGPMQTNDKLETIEDHVLRRVEGGMALFGSYASPMAGQGLGGSIGDVKDEYAA